MDFFDGNQQSISNAWQEVERSVASSKKDSMPTKLSR